LRLGARRHDHCEQSREDRKTHSASEEIYLGDTRRAARFSVQRFPRRESIAERASGKLDSGKFFFWLDYRKDYAARAEPKYWESGGVKRKYATAINRRRWGTDAKSEFNPLEMT